MRRRKQPSTLSSNVKSWLEGGLMFLGLIHPGDEIPKTNLVNRLLDLIKGTNLFTQE
jgi:hypothetical protein